MKKEYYSNIIGKEVWKKFHDNDALWKNENYASIKLNGTLFNSLNILYDRMLEEGEIKSVTIALVDRNGEEYERNLSSLTIVEQRLIYELYEFAIGSLGCNRERKYDLSVVRAGAIAEIKGLMGSRGISVLFAYDLDEGCSPVVKKNLFDDNNTFTLDKIEIGEDGKLFFDASSCGGNICLTEDTISTDVLLNIASWLNDKKTRY